MKKTITYFNGSVGGAAGNTHIVFQPLLSRLEISARVVQLHLATTSIVSQDLESLLLQSDGFIFATGTYWDSWGSPMQAFLENVAPFEGSPIWIGKPAAVLVSMHAVGGKGVLSRLQGILSMLGLLLPPMSGMAYSLAMQLAAEYAPVESSEFVPDFWGHHDFEVIAHNLLEAMDGGKNWRSWDLDKRDPRRRWAREPGSGPA